MFCSPGLFPLWGDWTLMDGIGGFPSGCLAKLSPERHQEWEKASQGVYCLAFLALGHHSWMRPSTIGNNSCQPRSSPCPSFAGFYTHPAYFLFITYFFRPPSGKIPLLSSAPGVLPQSTFYSLNPSTHLNTVPLWNSLRLGTLRMLFCADKEDIESIRCNTWQLFTEWPSIAGVLNNMKIWKAKAVSLKIKAEI